MSDDTPELMPMHQMLARLSGQFFSLEDTSSSPSGKGTYRLASGITYEGEFLDGMFHGQGALVFPDDGGKVVGVWKEGRLLSGKYIFHDGLTYKPKEWQYCTDSDRRFWSEIQSGIKLGDTPQLSNTPPPKLPPGCYDLGTAYYDPRDQCVYDYEGRFLRVPSRQEAAWALRASRIGVAPEASEARRERTATSQRELEELLLLQAEEAMEALERDRRTRLREMGVDIDDDYDK